MTVFWCWKMTESWCWKMTVSWCWKMTGIPVSDVMCSHVLNICVRSFSYLFCNVSQVFLYSYDLSGFSQVWFQPSCLFALTLVYFRNICVILFQHVLLCFPMNPHFVWQYMVFIFQVCSPGPKSFLPVPSGTPFLLMIQGQVKLQYNNIQ